MLTPDIVDYTTLHYNPSIKHSADGHAYVSTGILLVNMIIKVVIFCFNFSMLALFFMI